MYKNQSQATYFLVFGFLIIAKFTFAQKISFTPKGFFNGNERLVTPDFVSDNNTHGILIPNKGFEERKNLRRQNQSSHYSPPHHKRNSHTGYFGVFLSSGSSVFNASDGMASVNFPYIQTDANTNITTNDTASISKKFSPFYLPNLGLGFDYLRGIVYGEAGGEIAMNFGSQPGYGNLYLSSGVNLKFSRKSKFRFRLGIKYIYNHIYNEMGRIDNYQKTLNINGDDNFNPTFTASVSHGGYKYHYTTSETWPANYSGVGIAQTNMGLNPQLGLEYWTKNGRVIYRFNVAYNVTLSNNNWIYIEQTNASHKGGPFGHKAEYGLDNSFINYKYNGEAATIAPFDLNHVIFNFQIVFKSDFGKSASQKRR